MANATSPPVEVLPPLKSKKKYWTRLGIVKWLVATLFEDVPTIAGIDHSFSFPLRYFEKHGIASDWNCFLDDFQSHWTTDGDHVTVEDVRNGRLGNGAARTGNSRWRRIAEER